MIWLGMFLIVIGFALVPGRGAVPGAAAHRMIGLVGQQITPTPGYQREVPKSAWKIRVVGLVLLIAGFAIVFAVS